VLTIAYLNTVWNVDDFCHILLYAEFSAMDYTLNIVSNAVFSSSVTTCLENLEMSGNLKHVRDVVNSQGIVREMSGKNLVMEKCPKTGFCVPKHLAFPSKTVRSYVYNIHSDFILHNH